MLYSFLFVRVEAFVQVSKFSVTSGRFPGLNQYKAMKMKCLAQGHNGICEEKDGLVAVIHSCRRDYAYGNALRPELSATLQLIVQATAPSSVVRITEIRILVHKAIH